MAIPVVLSILHGDDVSPEALERAAKLVSKKPDLKIYLALIRTEQGEADQARALLQSLAHEPTLTSLVGWFSARLYAQRDEHAQAYEALERARDGQLRGPLGRDPAFATLRRDGRFRRLFPGIRNPNASWRPR
jgi:predicted Zn-dependent protease